jgi:hypothetical protein
MEAIVGSFALLIIVLELFWLDVALLTLLSIALIIFGVNRSYRYLSRRL